MKASICIITHNHEQWIADAIDGALMQVADFGFEVVIGEDCSTDGTMEVVQQYQRNHPDKIRVITSSENVGGKANLSRTMEAAQGEYIALCDGDDFWTDQNKLADQVAFLEANSDFVCSVTQAAIEYHGHLDKRFESNYARTQEVWQGEDVINTPSFCATASMVFRKADIWPLPKWFADVAWGDSALRGILAKQGKFHYLQRKAVTYRCNNWGALHQLRKKGKAYMADAAETIKHHILQPA